MTKMQEYMQKGEDYILKTYNRYPVVFEKGAGVCLYDMDGKRYLDFAAGIAVFALGYNNKAYNDALKAQIDKNNGYLEKSATDIEAWEEALPINADSKTGLLLDEATFTYAKRSREKIGEFLQAKGITVSEFGPYYTGFDHLASGFINEGIEEIHLLRCIL